MFECSICADDLLMDEEVSSIICGHIFHKKCILSWFEKSKTCPQCCQNFGTTPVQDLHHRVYLPDIINPKDDITDMLNDVLAQNELLKQQMNEKNKQIIEKNKEINEKSNVIDQYIREIFEKTVVLFRNDMEINKKSNEIKEKSNEINEKSNVIIEKNMKIIEKNVEIIEKNNEIRRLQKNNEIRRVFLLIIKTFKPTVGNLFFLLSHLLIAGIIVLFALLLISCVSP